MSLKLEDQNEFQTCDPRLSMQAALPTAPGPRPRDLTRSKEKNRHISVLTHKKND